MPVITRADAARLMAQMQRRGKGRPRRAKALSTILSIVDHVDQSRRVIGIANALNAAARFHKISRSTAARLFYLHREQVRPVLASLSAIEIENRLLRALVAEVPELLTLDNVDAIPVQLALAWACELDSATFSQRRHVIERIRRFLRKNPP